MNRKTIIAVAAVVLLAGAGVAALAVRPAVRDVTGDPGEKSGVDEALAAHEAQLRAVPGLTMLGTYTTPGEPPYIIVRVEEDFIAFAEIRPGDRVQVTLTERLAKGARAASAADVEVY